VLLLTLQISFQHFLRIVVVAESNSTHAQYVVLHRYFSHPKLTVQCTGGVALTLFTQLHNTDISIRCTKLALSRKKKHPRTKEEKLS
jgi:hypothetical protein